MKQTAVAELEAIYRLTTVLGAATSLTEMLPDFLQIVQEHFQNDSASVALLQNDGVSLLLAAWTPPQVKPANCRVSLPVGLEDQRQGAIRWGEDDAAILAQLRPLLPGLPPQSHVLWAPLRMQDRLIGVLQIGWRGQHTLDRDERRLLSALIDVCAAALARLRFTETLTQEVELRTLELRKRQQVSEGLRYVLSILNSNRPLEEILDYVIAQACWLLDTDTGVIYRWSGNATPLTIQAARGLPPYVVAQQHLSLDDGIVGRATTTRVPALVSDLLQTERSHLPDTVLGDGEVPRFRAILAVPIHTAHETYGCLTLYFADPHVFSEEDVSLASMLADHAALAVENARLRAEAEKTAAVAERNRLARELHDAVTQSLFSSSILADVIPKIWQRNPEEGERRLYELAQLNRGALAEMRALLMELRPKTLTEVDLDVLLESLRTAMQNRAQIPIELEAEKQCPLPADVRVGLYRIAQEALNNVVRHSHASRASIRLYCDHGPSANSVHLEVMDNGRGFTPDRTPAGHIGLDIMRERAESIEATLTIQSDPGVGTIICVSRLLEKTT